MLIWIFFYLKNFSGNFGDIELVAKSGKAIVYFTSDLAFNLPGFVIQYEYNRCLHDCNNHGHCGKNGNCKCDKSFQGDFCEQQICLAEMNGQVGPCNSRTTCQDGKCGCNKHTHGNF